MGYSNLCRQQWDEVGKKPDAQFRTEKKEAGWGVLAVETIYELSFDQAVENHETDGEDTEIWFNLNVWIVRGEILGDKWNII